MSRATRRNRWRGISYLYTLLSLTDVVWRQIFIYIQCRRRRRWSKSLCIGEESFWIFDEKSRRRRRWKTRLMIASDERAHTFYVLSFDEWRPASLPLTRSSLGSVADILLMLFYQRRSHVTHDNETPRVKRKEINAICFISHTSIEREKCSRRRERRWKIKNDCQLPVISSQPIGSTRSVCVCVCRMMDGWIAIGCRGRPWSWLRRSDSLLKAERERERETFEISVYIPWPPFLVSVCVSVIWSGLAAILIFVREKESHFPPVWFHSGLPVCCRDPAKSNPPARAKNTHSNDPVSLIIAFVYILFSFLMDILIMIIFNHHFFLVSISADQGRSTAPTPSSSVCPAAAVFRNGGKLYFLCAINSIARPRSQSFFSISNWISKCIIIIAIFLNID